jgi:recombination protein RecT
MTEQIQKTNGAAIEKPKPPTLADYFTKQIAPSLAAALPKHLTPDRMARLCLTAIRTTKDLAAVTPVSFAGEVMKLAQLGLEPNTPLGHAYLIPRKGECTTIIGYAGLIELARRSGLVKNIYAHVVYEGDKFSYSYGLSPTLEHVPVGESEVITHAYAVAHIEGASPLFEVLSLGRIEARRKRGGSKSGGFSPWTTDYAAMARKSAIRALWYALPKSAEMAMATEVDADDRPDIATIAAQQSATMSIVDALNASIEDQPVFDVRGEEVTNG